MIVDAHHHFWNTARNPLPWMTSDHDAIDGIFEPATLAPSLAAHGIDRTVLVQGADLDSDTDYLFELADDVAWVGAVTAWLPLTDPTRCRRRLAELARHSKFRAVRHLIHDEPDPHWIMQPEVLASLALVAESRLILELPVVFPRHFRDTAELAGRFPELRLVIDHLGKPPIGSDRMDEWEALIRSCASHQNVYAKISGLNTSISRADWDVDDLIDPVKVAIDSFGPDRLMCGSDWPVALLNGEYDRVWGTLVEVLELVAPDSVPRILGQTARDLYELDDPIRHAIGAG
jgi:L-fucono-1,5-lactonase